MCGSFNGNISAVTNSRSLMVRRNFWQAKEGDGVSYRDLFNSPKCMYHVEFDLFYLRNCCLGLEGPVFHIVSNKTNMLSQ